AEGRILEETGALLAPLASGVVSLAYSHLLSRPESAGYFQDAHHLAQRKETLMAWWVRTASDPYDAGAEFGTYMRRVANAHVKNAGMYPDVGIPAQLTIALMGWVSWGGISWWGSSPPPLTLTWALATFGRYSPTLPLIRYGSAFWKYPADSGLLRR